MVVNWNGKNKHPGLENKQNKKIVPEYSLDALKSAKEQKGLPLMI